MISSPDDDPVLNDVAIAEDGTVYVSGSGSRTIYILDGGNLEVWREDRQRLAFANGLLVSGNLLVHGGQTWTIFDRESREPTNLFSSINDSITDIDGIATDGCNGYFLTSIISDEVWWITSSGDAAPSSIGQVNGIDLHRRGNLLAIPRVGNSLSLYSSEQRCN